MNDIQKRFPATTTMEEPTFLNDKDIDAALYARLQSYSKGWKDPETGVTITRIFKPDLPKQAVMCEKAFIKSPKTYRKRFQVLLDRGFLIDEGDYYILPNIEKQFIMVPLDTLLFFRDVLKQDVYKIYIYLGQRWSWKHNEYIFTKGELLEHIGLSAESGANLRYATNILDVLKNNGLINFAVYYDGKGPRIRLTGFSLTYIHNDI